MKRLVVIAVSLLIFAVSAIHVSAIPLPGGLDEAVNKIGQIGDTIETFMKTVSSIIAFFARLLGFTGFFLFAFTLLTAAGLSAAGVPKGKYAFFSSLLICDALWALWHYSAHTLDSGFVLSAVRSNIVVVSPFIVFYIGRYAWRKICERLKRRKISSSEDDRESMIATAREFADESARLQSFLLRDIGEGFYSAETAESARKLSALCDILRNPSTKEN